MILQAYDKILLRRAFTLIEMIIVMVIIAAMVTVVLPYAAKSNDAMKIEHDCLSIAEVFRYAADLATDTGLAVRIVIDSQNKSFVIETTDPMDEQVFVPIEYLGGTVHRYDPKIRIVDMTGFRVDGENFILIFEPSQPWPQASISLSTTEQIKTITTRGRQVEIEDSSI